jgi:predicted transcriptional regulator
MTFRNIYKPDDFLRHMDDEKYYTAAYIAKKVGCHISTAKLSLEKLTTAGLTTKITIDDGAVNAYVKVR